MTRAYWLVPAVLALAACGSKDTPAQQGDLRSDMPLRTAKYFMDNTGELAETDAICTAWKASQRPPMSWPSVVVNNCNNADTARTMLLNKAETEKLRREAGV